jgi:hypothetical protein
MKLPNGSYCYNVPFIREEEGRITNFAVVRIHTRTATETREEQIQAIKEAVTAWIKNTLDGQACWEESMRDLSVWNVHMRQRNFQAFLKGYSGTLWQFNTVVMDEGIDCIAFDCPLVLAD